MSLDSNGSDFGCKQAALTTPSRLVDNAHDMKRGGTVNIHASILTFLLALTWTISANAQTATLDSVDVQFVDGEIVGIRDGSRATRFRLQKGEQIQWMDARGIVGGVLTDRRFFAVSSTSAGWQETRLDRDDGTPYIELGANVLLCITQKRILSFSGPSGSVSVDRLSPHELITRSSANEHVASVVTDRRAIAYSSGRTSGVDFKFGVREQFQDLSTLATVVTVRTTERLLVFRHSSGSWADERF